MSRHYYIKYYFEILDDIKMCMLSDHLYRRVTELFLVAGKYKWSNALPPIKEMAFMLRTDEKELAMDLHEIEEQTGIVKQVSPGKWIVTNFEKRQDADTPKERTERYRNNKQKLEYYSNETFQESVTDRYTENSIEENSIERESLSSDPFDDMRQLVERMTGYPIPSNQAEILAIGEFVDWGVTEADIRDALSFLSGNGKTIRGATGLRGSVKTAIAKRTQKANAKPAEKPYIPEEHASEVYG